MPEAGIEWGAGLGRSLRSTFLLAWDFSDWTPASVGGKNTPGNQSHVEKQIPGPVTTSLPPVGLFVIAGHSDGMQHTSGAMSALDLTSLLLWEAPACLDRS